MEGVSIWLGRERAGGRERAREKRGRRASPLSCPLLFPYHKRKLPLPRPAGPHLPNQESDAWPASEEAPTQIQTLSWPQLALAPLAFFSQLPVSQQTSVPTPSAVFRNALDSNLISSRSPANVSGRLSDPPFANHIPSLSLCSPPSPPPRPPRPISVSYPALPATFPRFVCTRAPLVYVFALCLYFLRYHSHNAFLSRILFPSSARRPLPTPRTTSNPPSRLMPAARAIQGKSPSIFFFFLFSFHHVSSTVPAAASRHPPSTPT